jgi:hypothetical protein
MIARRRLAWLAFCVALIGVASHRLKESAANGFLFHSRIRSVGEDGDSRCHTTLDQVGGFERANTDPLCQHGL